MTTDVIFFLLVAVITAIIEGISASMVSIWFSAGAVAAMLVGLVTDSFLLQLCVFLAVSALSLALFRQKCIKSKKKNIATNADRVIGKTGRVTERIDNNLDTGAVNIEGMEWTARSQSADKVFEKDTLVRVENLSGAKVIVGEAESN